MGAIRPGGLVAGAPAAPHRAHGTPPEARSQTGRPHESREALREVVYDPPAYCQAIKVTGAQSILFLSGQVAYDKSGGVLHPGNFQGAGAGGVPRAPGPW